MSAIILFLTVLAVIVGWWLSGQRLTAKPWLEEGPMGDFPGTGAIALSAAKLGLRVFLAVAGFAATSGFRSSLACAPPRNDKPGLGSHTVIFAPGDNKPSRLRDQCATT